MTPLPPSVPPSRVPLYIAAVVLVVGLVFCLTRCASAAGIQLPPLQYCADSLTNGVYNGVRVGWHTGACAPLPPPGAGCPATILSNGQTLTRQTRGNIAYVNSTGIRVGGDLTMYDNIWGHTTSSDTLVPWPGRVPSMPIITMSRHQYIAAQFTVPSGVSQALYGEIARTTYSYGIDMTVAISRTCGDFNPTNPRCLSAIPTGDFPHWQTSPTGNQCPVTDGVYYLNIKVTSPAQVTTTCPNASSPTCPMGTTNITGG